jgi:hypothetical protein
MEGKLAIPDDLLSRLPDFMLRKWRESNQKDLESLLRWAWCEGFIDALDGQKEEP